MTPADRRIAVIDGLLDLAAFLEANPGVPTPSDTRAYYFVRRENDEAMTDEIDKIASALGKPVDDLQADHGHYGVDHSFGPVEYRAVAILAKARAQHDADNSYRGCVNPD
ncbi:hypothetical protein AB0K48_11710 [Nonomuraea sp. NPDC055795]